MRRLNVGCGTSPTEGWVNFDNSPSVKLSKHGFTASLLHGLGLIAPLQKSYIDFCKARDIAWADATRRIPVPSDSVEVLYSSHMLEHLDGQEAMMFLKEARRVLAPGGVIRLAVPDIKKQVDSYLQSKDADQFIARTNLCVPRPRTFAQKLAACLVGARHHQWMYDGGSLSKLLSAAGFLDPVVLAAGETTIQDHAPLNLNERDDESVYVEARKG